MFLQITFEVGIKSMQFVCLQGRLSIDVILTWGLNATLDHHLRGWMLSWAVKSGCSGDVSP